MPCLGFLQDETLFHIKNMTKCGEDDDLVNLCEIFTTIESIICIGMQS